jgi:hypothetical protein
MKALENPALDLDLRCDIGDLALDAVNAKMEYLLQCRMLDRGMANTDDVIQAIVDWNEKKELLAELMDEAVAGLMAIELRR